MDAKDSLVVTFGSGAAAAAGVAGAVGDGSGSGLLRSMISQGNNIVKTGPFRLQKSSL